MVPEWGWITAAIAVIGGSVKFFPQFWRGLIRAIASPVLLGIEREVRMAREEQVEDLTEEVKRLRHELGAGSSEK